MSEFRPRAAAPVPARSHRNWLAVVGSVAVTRIGGRTGKGAGFADLEILPIEGFSFFRFYSLTH